MIISIMYKSKFRMGNMILRRVIMIPCEMFFWDHLRNTRIISLIGSGRGRVGGLGDVLLQLWQYTYPCPGPTTFPVNLC